MKIDCFFTYTPPKTPYSAESHVVINTHLAARSSLQTRYSDAAKKGGAKIKEMSPKRATLELLQPPWHGKP